MAESEKSSLIFEGLIFSSNSLNSTDQGESTQVTDLLYVILTIFTKLGKEESFLFSLKLFRINIFGFIKKID